MSAANRKVFRIERARSTAGEETGVQTDQHAEARHQEIMTALRDLKQGNGESGGAPEQDALTSQMIQDYKTDLMEANKLKTELHRIYGAIARTKQEIATIHKSGLKGKPMSRAADELSAIVGSTETATDTILQAAEDIDQNATNLAASLKHQRHTDMVGDIQDQITNIFEACNFQDLTGQRVTKVVNTFRFIEERILEMIEIWGGLESFNNVETTEPDETLDESLLHGPALDNEEDVASQNDIDALFD